MKYIKISKGTGGITMSKEDFNKEGLRTFTGMSEEVDYYIASPFPLPYCAL